MPPYDHECRTAWRELVSVDSAGRVFEPLPAQHPYQAHRCRRRSMHHRSRHVCECGATLKR